MKNIERSLLKERLNEGPSEGWIFLGLRQPHPPLAPAKAHFENTKRQAIKVLSVFSRHRRMVQAATTCPPQCQACLAPHLPKVMEAMLAGKPVRLVLPAFPGKSPNPAKVLGSLPDTAEEQALGFLNSLCEEVQTLYKPGARIVLCSDGRVFSDLVGMAEGHVTAYQQALGKIIREQEFSHLSTFNLDELYGRKSFDEMRRELMDKFGQPLETLKEKVKNGGKGSEMATEKEAHRMYCGITRFLFEDALLPGQTKSRTAIQKGCRVRAYEVIRRSNAWSELVAARFPAAVRLSIHPQSCGARKLGIQLLAANTWLTPWHGVAVKTGNTFVLKKRAEAERLGATLVRDEQGRPIHYELKGKSQNR